MTDLRRDSDVDGVAVAALRAALGLPGVVRAGLALTVVGGRQLRFLPSDQDRLDTGDWCLIDAFDRLPLNDAIRTGRPVVVGSPAALAQQYPELAEHRGGIALSVVALPLGHGGVRLGGLLIYADREVEAVTDEQLQLASFVTDALITVRSEVTTAQQRGTYPLPADASAPGQARRVLRATLAGEPVDDETLDAALLCLSELVTNVVMHEGRPPSMDVERNPTSLTVRIHHEAMESGSAGPRTAADDPLGISGRGLVLVEALTTEWGEESTPPDTTTWFRIDL